MKIVLVTVFVFWVCVSICWSCCPNHNFTKNGRWASILNFVPIRYCWDWEPIHFTEYGGFHIWFSHSSIFCICLLMWLPYGNWHVLNTRAGILTKFCIEFGILLNVAMEHWLTRTIIAEYLLVILYTSGVEDCCKLLNYPLRYQFNSGLLFILGAF